MIRKLFKLIEKIKQLFKKEEDFPIIYKKK